MVEPETSGAPAFTMLLGPGSLSLFPGPCFGYLPTGKVPFGPRRADDIAHVGSFRSSRPEEVFGESGRSTHHCRRALPLVTTESSMYNLVALWVLNTRMTKTNTTGKG